MYYLDCAFHSQDYLSAIKNLKQLDLLHLLWLGALLELLQNNSNNYDNEELLVSYTKREIITVSKVCIPYHVTHIHRTGDMWVVGIEWWGTLGRWIIFSLVKPASIHLSEGKKQGCTGFALDK